MVAATMLLGRTARIGSIALLGGGTTYALASNRERIRNDSPAGWTTPNTNTPRDLRPSGPKNKSLPSSEPYTSQLDALRQSSKLEESTDPSPSEDEDNSAWATFTHKFGVTGSSFSSIEWSEIGDSIKNYIVPSWVRILPDLVQKLQRELSMAPGSLGDEIWAEAADVELNPEICLDAQVRVGNGLCREEQTFRRRRQRHIVSALASYLGIDEEDIHPDDVPVIAMCGSGGGLRALVSGTGSYLAAQEAGLWDCLTYTAGVSGSCWLQVLYNSELTGQNHNKLVGHLKSRLGIHIAFPPKALDLLTTAPTNKYLLSGLIEKLKGDPGADFGLVDIYGILLSARLLVPRGELDLSNRDLKLSNQRAFIDGGANPMPIYTAVRHEIPRVDESGDSTKESEVSDELKERALEETWFQWFEFTPYELFCEELTAGIPMWALGRQFNNGRNVVPPGEYAVPELRISGLMGVWGSAFCATLAHYYKEIRPVVRELAGFGGIDSMIENKNDDLVKVHPIHPGMVPNFVLGMKDKLPDTCPESVFRDSHLELMDAGMSNNLPIYPLLRPGREVDAVIAFDASAEIKQENWLAVVDGYARQRGVKGWPMGTGWPKPGTKPSETAKALAEAESSTQEEVDKKIVEAQREQAEHNEPEELHDLGYCNVWVGSTEERTTTEEPPPSKRLFFPSTADHSDSDFQLMQPDAGIAVIYFPFIPNPDADTPEPKSTTSAKERSPPRLPGSPPPSPTSAPLAPKASNVDPDVDDFMSTWNFVYTPEQIDSVIGLAKANFQKGEGQVKRVIRGIYERKRRARLRAESEREEERRKEEELQRRNWDAEGFIHF
ncbi:hypothetical protein FQN54_005209 [Arachnomyces sp. PD_36]|nr:hypothetical protein FQN54_005209 [Arachnomyces sp. PD_36]